MPTELGSAHGTITIEAQLAQAANQISQFSRKSEQEFDRVAASSSRAQQSMTEFASALGVTLTIAGAVQLGRLGLELGKSAAQADAAAESFDHLAARINENSDDILAGMQKAARGSVSNASLILAANRAIGSEVVHTGAELNQLLEIASATGRAFGFTTTEAFERLIGGLSKLEPELLDELNITVKLNEVYDAYAETLGKTSEQLTEAQRRQALFNAVILETKPAVDAATKSAGDSFEQWNQFNAAFDNLKDSAGDLINAFDFIGTWTHDFQRASDELQTLVGWFEQLKDWADRIKAMDIGQMLRDAVAGGSALPANPFAGGGGFGGGGGGGGSGGFGGGEINPNQTEIDQAKLDRYAKSLEIDRQASEDILNENTSYQNRRAASEEQYQEAVARSAADFAKNRMRAQEDYENSILDLMRSAQQRELALQADHDRQIARMQSDSAKRLADLQENLDRTIAQRRADSAERLADLSQERDETIAQKRADSMQKLLDIDKDYNRQKEDAVREQSINLEEAAANLDARALFFAARRFRLEQEKRDEAHDEAVANERTKLEESIGNVENAYQKKVADEEEALQKSINQANEAYARQVADENEALNTRIADANAAYTQQLSDAKAADSQRLIDMAAHFAEVKQREDDDQVERMGRMAADHTEEMTQFGTEHAERLTQISAHAAEERNQLDTEFANHMAQLGINIGEENKLHDSMVEAAERSFDELLLHIQNKLQNLPDVRPDQLSPDQQTLANLYGQRTTKQAQMLAVPRFSPEFFRLGGELDAIDERINALEQKGVLLPGSTPKTAGAASIDMATLAGTTTTLPPPAAAPVGAGNLVVTFAQGAVQIYGAVGQPVEQLAATIDQRILRAVQTAAGRV